MPQPPEPADLSPLFEGLTLAMIRQFTPGELAAWCRRRRAALGVELDGPTCRTCGGDGVVDGGAAWCPSCTGNGIESAPLCARCRGVGMIRLTPDRRDSNEDAVMVCPDCNGGSARLDGLLDRAGLPRVYQGWTWDTYEALAEPSDSQSEAFGLATSLASDPRAFEARNGRRGLCLVGSAGTRKTGICVPAFAMLARSSVGRARFISWRAWLDEMTATWRGDSPITSAQMIHSAAQSDPLMLDDFGGALGQTGREWVADTAWKLLEERASYGGATLVTTNRTLVEIEKQYGEAVVSRLAALCVMLDVKGDDERRRVAA